MLRLRLLALVLLIGLQGALPCLGHGAESSRNLSATATLQEKGGRVAIVIGNSSYPSGALANPKNDATAMASALKQLGFDVELKLDTTKADIDGLLRRFSGKAEKATVAALFYAGHGIQVGGSNYLVPIDANPRNERDLKRDMVKMDDIIDDMGDARVKLVFFDACRDNPLARSFSRGGSRGMAAPVEATGTLISFATKHGNTAADGDGKHSPYTKALLTALENPSGVEIEQLLRRVQQGVKAETKGQQEPWRYGSLDGDFYFRAAEPTDGAKVSQEAVDKAVQDAVRRASEQAAREKVELQQSIKMQQEAAERAALEAVKRVNEQAAREREELQKTLKAQQAASDRAMAEALRQANEQATRERAEMQKSMEKMLKDALARQNAELASERTSQQPSRREQASATTNPEPAPAAASTINQPQAAIQLASIAPTTVGVNTKPSAPILNALSTAPGDEWEYVSKDSFGKQQKIIGQVKAVVQGTGILETYTVDGKDSREWVFDGKPSLIGLNIDASLLFSPYWSGSDIDALAALNGSKCATLWRCSFAGKEVGEEKITVAAGSFNTRRLNITVTVKNSFNFAQFLEMEVWYSMDHKHLIRQTVKGRSSTSSGFNQINEVIELSAYRPGPR